MIYKTIENLNLDLFPERAQAISDSLQGGALKFGPLPPKFPPTKMIQNAIS